MGFSNTKQTGQLAKVEITADTTAPAGTTAAPGLLVAQTPLFVPSSRLMVTFFGQVNHSGANGIVIFQFNDELDTMLQVCSTVGPVANTSVPAVFGFSLNNWNPGVQKAIRLYMRLAVAGVTATLFATAPSKCVLEVEAV